MRGSLPIQGACLGLRRKSRAYQMLAEMVMQILADSPLLPIRRFQ
jgi:hypothetical protein